MTDPLGYVMAFLLGAMVMALVFFIYMLRLNKQMRTDLKLMYLAEGMDPAAVDEIPPWWKFHRESRGKHD